MTPGKVMNSATDHLITSFVQLEALYRETRPPSIAKETDRITPAPRFPTIY
jgi:hypothetical protein